MFTETTDTSHLPLKMSSSILSLDQFVEGWTLAQFEGGADPAAKQFEYWVSWLALGHA
jgi:hypothetical protein